MKDNLFASLLVASVLVFAAGPAAGDNLADRHVQGGLTCAECHVEELPSRAPRMDVCLSCHGGSYEELARASEDKKPNPHYTHMGDKACSVCHKGHKAPEFFCNDCHRFKVQMP